jgi:hypothetical protein
MNRLIYIFILMSAINLVTFCIKNNGSGNNIVELKQNDDGFYRLFVNNKEFFIKGAGLEFGNIEALAKYGGNSFRTWRTRNGHEDALDILNQAHKHGLLVLMGLDVARERHGFDYNDSVEVKKQFDIIKGEVERLKDHPALLGWAIGNELNLGASNLKVYNAVNDISKMIHEIDPNHPTTTTMGGVGKREVDYVKENCTDIDFLSIQMYGDIVNLQKRILDAGWEGPYMVTEWGATGHWEVARTEWNVAIEQSSKEKAEAFIDRYKRAILSDPVNCLGSYVFLWAQKQERTPTWYGMFLENGNITETVDAIHFAWTGEWPENRCPTLESFILDQKTAYDNIKLKAGQKYKASVLASDYENDSIKYRWEILPESTDLGWGGDYESRPESCFSAELDQSEIEIESPITPGAYRLFIYVTDEGNRSATANIPFLVEK